MIQTHSDDPDVAAAATKAAQLVRDTLATLPAQSSFDYGGHILQIGDYGVCETCTRPIAEAQAGARALFDAADNCDDEVVAEHIELAGELLKLEAHAAEIRAELHNGEGSEPIINTVLGFVHDRKIHDRYEHSHHSGNN